mmetsp:Transcript_107352/g.342010  ORF Transcript_107352/g.342010 Transcript_107352/m.342010 type:complete len:234 (+) Transcript_107352:87-788(+)
MSFLLAPAALAKAVADRMALGSPEAAAAARSRSASATAPENSSACLGRRPGAAFAGLAVGSGVGLGLGVGSRQSRRSSSSWYSAEVISSLGRPMARARLMASRSTSGSSPSRASRSFPWISGARSSPKDTGFPWAQCLPATRDFSHHSVSSVKSRACRSFSPERETLGAQPWESVRRTQPSYLWDSAQMILWHIADPLTSADVEGSARMYTYGWWTTSNGLRVGLSDTSMHAR